MMTTLKEISSVPCRCQGFLDGEIAAEAKILSALIVTLPDQVAGQALDKLCTLYPLDKMKYSSSSSKIVTELNLSHLRRIRGKRRTSDSNQLEQEVIECDFNTCY